MQYRRRTSIAFFLITLFASFAIGGDCKTLQPPEGPNTSHPCGVWGVSCPGQMCCPYAHECGGHKGRFTTCPEGYCCYVGEDWPRVGASPDGGHTVKAKPYQNDWSY